MDFNVSLYSLLICKRTQTTTDDYKIQNKSQIRLCWTWWLHMMATYDYIYWITNFNKLFYNNNNNKNKEFFKFFFPLPRQKCSNKVYSELTDNQPKSCRKNKSVSLNHVHSNRWGHTSIISLHKHLLMRYHNILCIVATVRGKKNEANECHMLESALCCGEY